MIMHYNSIFKVFLSSFLLSVLLFKIKPQNIFSVLVNMDLFLLSISFLFIPILYTIKALKWKILLKIIDVDISLNDAIRAILIGSFYGMITPGKSGELMRAYYIDAKKSKSIPTIMWDKFMDISALIILSILTVFIFFSDPTLYYITVLLAVSLIIGFGLIMNRKVVSLSTRILGIAEESREGYLEGMWSIAKNRKNMANAFVLTLCFYATAFIVAGIVLRSLFSSLNVLLVFTLPVIVLFGNVPVTISGLGLREYVAVLCFDVLGEDASFGFSFSILLFVIIMFVPGVIGYVLMIRHD